MGKSAASPMNTAINRTVFLLSLLGIAMAIYVLQSFIRRTGIVCVTSGCELVRKSPASYLFGFFPVPAVGLIGYTILAISAFLRTLKPNSHQLLLITRLMMGMATFGVLFVSWFTYTEVFIIKGVCTWCAISAVNMVTIFILLVKERMSTHFSRAEISGTRTRPARHRYAQASAGGAQKNLGRTRKKRRVYV